MRGISWLAENRLASQEGLCYMEWVSKYGLWQILAFRINLLSRSSAENWLSLYSRIIRQFSPTSSHHSQQHNNRMKRSHQMKVTASSHMRKQWAAQQHKLFTLKRRRHLISLRQCSDICERERWLEIIRLITDVFITILMGSFPAMQGMSPRHSVTQILGWTRHSEFLHTHVILLNSWGEKWNNMAEF